MASPLIIRLLAASENLVSLDRLAAIPTLTDKQRNMVNKIVKYSEALAQDALDEVIREEQQKKQL